MFQTKYTSFIITDSPLKDLNDQKKGLSDFYFPAFFSAKTV